MSKRMIQEQVNIDIIPVKQKGNVATNICVGDLHGNAIKLLYFLVRHGICSISPTDYERLVQIYKTRQEDLNSDLIHEFNKIVSGLQISKSNTLVRLIGDELADRGSNDYFVLKILQKLHDGGVKTEILLSNHGIEFVAAYELFEQRNKEFAPTLLDPFHHAPSLYALSNLVKKGLVTHQEVFNIISSSYKPNLKLIGYSLDLKTGSITIFSHAGMGLKVIKMLAKKFEVSYHDDSIFTLANTIEKINKEFMLSVMGDKVNRLYSRNEMMKGYLGKMKLNDNNALEFVLWNRAYEELDRPIRHNGYSVSFVHGHDSTEKSIGNIYNLDDSVGKDITLHQGEYKALLSDEVRYSQQVELEFAHQKFNEQIQRLIAEGIKLKQKGEIEAYIAVAHLRSGLIKAGNTYFSNHPTPESYEAFKLSCETLINEAREKLEKHHGWKQILGNIALAIIGLGFGYLIAAGINKVLTGNFFFFREDSVQKIDAIEKSIQAVAPVQLCV